MDDPVIVVNVTQNYIETWTVKLQLKLKTYDSSLNVNIIKLYVTYLLYFYNANFLSFDVYNKSASLRQAFVNISGKQGC